MQGVLSGNANVTAQTILLLYPDGCRPYGRMSRDPGSRDERQISRDRETIRGWADRHDVVPVQEREAGEPTDRFRMVSEDRMSESHERLEWDEFFDHLHEGDHAVIYHGEGVDEPFEVAGHDDLESRVDEENVRDRLIEGETVTSEITETTVVEAVVVEEIDVESELVDRRIVDQRVVDVDLLDRECTSCDFVEDDTVGTADQFDRERYLSTIGDSAVVSGTHTGDRMETDERTTTEPTGTTGMDERTTTTDTMDADERMGSIDVPYDLAVDVEETWTVMRELTEEFTVESRITGTETTEAETIEDHDIDVQGLHRSIAESGLIHDERSADEFLAHSNMESEMAEPDRVETRFTRERTVEDEVADRKRLRADVTEGELLELETIRSQDVVTEERPPGDEEAMTGSVDLTDDAVGNTVVNAMGDEVGMVSGVEEDRGLVYVDVHPGLAERIQSALGWGSADEEDYTLQADQIRRITDDQVELRSEEHLPEDERER